MREGERNFAGDLYRDHSYRSRDLVAREVARLELFSILWWWKPGRGNPLVDVL